MFVEACDKVRKFTRPLIISIARVDGTCESGMGTYFMINRDGWAITAAHCLSPLFQQRANAEKMKEIDDHNAQHPDDRKEYDPKWIRAHSFWWGDNRIRFETIHMIQPMDLAIVKLVNVPPDFVTDYPTFASPETVKQGMSLCRLGYPFIKVNTTFTPENSSFKVDIHPEIVKMCFPNDGILTRIVPRPVPGAPPNDPVNNDVPLMVETSTPGLLGQSGGPIFDRNGNIVAMQSSTANIDLGFGDMQVNGKYMPEQYLNVGLGPYVGSIVKQLDHFGVKYKSDSDDDGYRIIG